MPGFNRTGPMGMGPMTGRRMGQCVGNQPGFYGRCGGCGRGFGFRYSSFSIDNYSGVDELKKERDYLNNLINNFEKKTNIDA